MAISRLPKGLLSGKVRNKHHVYSREVISIITCAKGIAEVNKVKSGPLNRKGGSVRQAMRIEEMPGGLRVTVRTGTSLQPIYIYTEFPQLVRQRLEKYWERSYA